MSISQKIFWIVSILLLVVSGFDILQNGFNNLNVIILLSLPVIGFLVKIANGGHWRAVILTLAYIPIVLYKSINFVPHSDGIETSLVVFVLLAALIHCADVAQSMNS